MNPSVSDTYLETQVLTATPQRLRLMLIEAALRSARGAMEAWRAADHAAGDEAADKCRDVLCELIGGIQPGDNPVAQRVLGIYSFLFTSLVSAQLRRDVGQLAEIARVLEEELATWREVCAALGDRPVAAAAAAQVEEVAPQRVSGPLAAPHFGGSGASLAAQFSIDA